MPRRPNFLIIMSDQHHAGFMGCAGNRIARTPNLDRLAAEGVRFTNAYCPSPLCVPSRMSFLTGLTPTQNRVWTNDDMLGSDMPTFAHALGADGYETVLCGRMHFTGPDQAHGFETRLVGDITPVQPGLSHGFGGELRNASGQSLYSAETSGPGLSYVHAYDEAVTDAAVRFLRGNKGGRERPLCMIVGLYHPHCPFIAPGELYREYEGRIDMPVIPEGYFDDLHPIMQQWLKDRRIWKLDSEVIRRARTAYYAMVEWMDERIGRILGALSEGGLSEDTVVVYASDHGELAGEHGMFWKSNFYEGSVRVPLIFSCPGRFARGSSVDAIVNLTDIAPTLIDLAGSDEMRWLGNRSLNGFLRGGGVDGWDNATTSEHYGLFTVPPGRMVRRDEWKLVHYHGCERPLMFNLAEDPGEMRDLGESESHAATRERLMAEVLDGWDGEAVRRNAEQKKTQSLPLMARWARATRPDISAQWSPPPGVEVNSFPQ